VQEKIMDEQIIVTEEVLRDIDAVVAPMMERSIIPIVVSTTGGRTAHGTGTYFAIGETRFIVTAAHVLKQAHDTNAQLYFPGLMSGKPSFCPMKGYAAWSKDKVHAHRPDVAAWRFTDPSVTPPAGRVPIRLEDIDRDPPGESDVYCVAGFPVAHNQHIKTGENGPCTAIKLYAGRYEGSTDTLRCEDGETRINPESHLLLNGRTKTLEPVLGNNVPLPELGGVSGGQIWRLTVSNEGGRTQTRAALHAVQTGDFKNGRIIKGTKWPFVLQIIFAVWPELRPAAALLIPKPR